MKQDQDKTLLELCKEDDYRIELKGRQYCVYSLSQKVSCIYQAPCKDDKGYYNCIRIDTIKGDLYRK